MNLLVNWYLPWPKELLFKENKLIYIYPYHHQCLNMSLSQEGDITASKYSDTREQYSWICNVGIFWQWPQINASITCWVSSSNLEYGTVHESQSKTLDKMSFINAVFGTSNVTLWYLKMTWSIALCGMRNLVLAFIDRSCFAERYSALHLLLFVFIMATCHKVSFLQQDEPYCAAHSVATNVINMKL